MAYQTINPFTEKLVKTFNEHTDAQLEAIIAKAEDTYENDWSLRPLAERKVIIKKAASIMREKLDEFAKPITLEMGKPIAEARAEVKKAASSARHFAEHGATYIQPEAIPGTPGRRAS